MEQRNLIVFVVLAILILIGWMWVQNALWPPKPKTPQGEKATEKVDWSIYGPAARAVNVIANRGLALGALPENFLLGRDLYFTPAPRRRLARWENLSDAEQALAILMPPPLPSTIGVLALYPRKKEGPTLEEIPFGGDEFFIKGSFTTRGAGVRKLSLTKFQAANWLGEPAKGELELIPDDPEMASFLLYHYPASKEKDWEASPVLTLGQQIWKLESNQVLNDGTQEVRFSTTVPEEAYRHLRIYKTYRLAKHDYHLSLLLEIEDKRSGKEGDTKAVNFRYQLAGAHGLPIEGVWYTGTYRDVLIGVNSQDGFYRTKEDAMRIGNKKGGDAVPDPLTGPGNSLLQYAGVATQFFGSVFVVDNKQPDPADGGVDMKSILRWARGTAESSEMPGILRDFDEKTLLISDAKKAARDYIMLPRVQKLFKEAKLTRDSPVVISYYELDGRRVATWIRPGQKLHGYLDDVTVRVNSESIELKPGDKVAHRFLLYHGPVKTMLLGQFSGDEKVDPDLVNRYTNTLHLRTLTDYRMAGPLGRFSQAIHFTDLLIAVTNLMHWLLYYLHFLVGSYGLTIILLTIMVRGLMFPISRKQAYFSVKMQEMAPELKKIKEKYPNDRKAQTEATMELYRKNKVNPLGSCLPLLMQMPIFLGLYYALQESIHFRLAEFLWIKNLAAPDMLLWWTEKIPWISEPDNMGGIGYLGPFLNLLPLIAVSFMIVQQKMMTPPAMDEQQEMQQKMMKYMMILMGFLFYKVASGLCIYFISSSLWGLAERRLLPKKKLATAGGAQLPPPPSKSGPPGKGPRGKGPKGKDKPNSNETVQKVKNWWAEVLKQAKKK